MSREKKPHRGPNKLPPLAYLPRFLRCPSRWYCGMAGRAECDKCGCFLRPVSRVR